MRSTLYGLLLAVFAVSVAFTAYLTGQNRLLNEQVERLRAEIVQVSLEHSLQVTASAPASEAATHCELQTLPLSESKLTRLCIELGIVAPTAQPLERPVGTLQNATLLRKKIHKKYAPLLAQSSLNRVDHDHLMLLLQTREAIESAPITDYLAAEGDVQSQVVAQAAQLAEVDAQIARLLDDESQANYALLKDSGFEHYQLEQFVASLDEALSEQQKNNILMSKLQLKSQFDQQLETLLLKGEGGQEEALALVESFRSRFYRESAAHLGQEALERLRAFEDAEFAAIKKSLKKQLSQSQ